MKSLLWSLAPVALFQSAPARAADVASLGCVRAELGADYVRTTTDMIFKALSAGDKKLPQLAVDPIIKAAATCASRNGWSTEAADLARVITLMEILREGMERTLPAEDVDVDTVKRVYAALDEPTRRGFLGKDATRDASSVTVAKALIAAKVNVAGDRGEHIGVYLATLAIAEFVQPEFAAA